MTLTRVFYTIFNIMRAMRKTNVLSSAKTTRSSRSFTIDRSILEYVQRTRARRSHSERVNELLHRAIAQEQQEALEREAAAFYGAESKEERAETRAFAAASMRSITRGER